LKLLISACHSLRVLAISDIVDDELVKIITISCPSLHCIRLSSCDGVTDDSLKLLAKTYSHLLSLDLGGDSCHISDAGIKSLTQSCT
ncbi:hypothetical protein GLOIN_2v1597744, partial [Rhizophagus irregularis DAOM 181602=DAOM 197198]